MQTRLLPIIALSSSLMLGGCASTKTMLEHGNLDVASKMSATIFLDPVAPDKKTILVQVRNTSDQANFNPNNMIVAKLERAGYTITDNPDYANYMLQANILKVARMDKDDAQKVLFAGYGGTIEGAVIGAAIGSVNSGKAMLAGGLLGSALGTVADALVREVTYSVITDIQLSERAGDGVVINEHSHTTLSQGTGGKKQVTSNEATNWRRHQTRVVSIAGKVNLKFEDAKPELLDGISNSVTGIFG